MFLARKVGYASSSIYSSPPYLNSPPFLSSSPISSFPGPIYHSKPPGPIIDGPPYKFDSHGEHIISNEEFHALGLSESAPIKPIVNDGITGTSGSSVNIHHHYHHIDGAASNSHDNSKAPAIVVNNPIPFPNQVVVNNPIPVNNGLVSGKIIHIKYILIKLIYL